MSTVLNKETNSDQAVALLAKSDSRTAISKGDSASIAALTLVTAPQMQQSFRIGEESSTDHYLGNDALLAAIRLQDEETKTDNNQVKINGRLGDSLGAQKADAKKGNAPATGRNAIFDVAGQMTKLQAEAQSSMVQQMQDRLKAEEAQLQGLINLMEFMSKYVDDLNEFEKNPTEANAQKLIDLLEQHFKGNSSETGEINELKQLLAEGQMFDKDYGWIGKIIWQYVAKYMGSEFQDLEKQIMGNNPQLYAEFMQQGQKAFEKQIQSLVTQITETIIILSLLTGNTKDLMFKVQALIEQLEQMEVQLNSDQSSEQNQISKSNIKNQEHQEQKAEDAIKKLEKAEHHHHHGIFGWLEDLVDSIVDAIKKLISTIGNACKDLVTGHFKAFGKDLLKASGLEGLIKSVKEMFTGHFLEGFCSLVADAIMGPEAAMLLQGTPIMKDITQAVELVVHAVVALVEIVGAGLLYLGSFGQDMQGVDTLANEAKKNGIDCLENPQLQAIADLAMIAVIVAAACTGQEWLAGIMLVLLVMNDATDSSGHSLMSDLTEGIAKAFHIPKVVADLLVIVVVTIATLGAGGAEAAAEEGVEMGVEAGTELAEGSTETLGETVENGLQQTLEESDTELENGVNSAENDTRSTLRKAYDAVKNGISKVGEAIGPRAGSAMLIDGMLMQQTNFAADAGKAAHSKALQDILEVLQYVLIILGSLGMAAGAAESLEGSSIASKIMDTLDMKPEELTGIAQQLQAGGQMTQGVVGMMEGGDQIIIGHLQEELQKYKGNLTLDEVVQKIADGNISANNERLKEIMKGFQEMLKADFQATSAASEGVAQALEQLA